MAVTQADVAVAMGSLSITDNDDKNRLFNTSAYDDYATNPEVYQDDGYWYALECPYTERCRGCGSRQPLTGAIVIAVDGACRGNGTPHARAAYAALVHPLNGRYNASELLPGHVQTNQRAELSAGLLALDIASNIKDLNKPSRINERLITVDVENPESELAKVVIKSDSQFPVKSMTKWIYKWRRNGYINAKMLPVVNQDLFKELDRKVKALNDRGVEVQFWHVPRHQSQMADYLVNSRLDGLTADEAMERYLEDEA